MHHLHCNIPRVFSHHSELGGQHANHRGDIRPCHYQIDLEGCTNDIYRVIPAEKHDLYQGILGDVNSHDDFARNADKEHRDAFRRLKPAFYGSDPEASFHWVDKQALWNGRRSAEDLSDTVQIINVANVAKRRRRSWD
jgi:hypothetical protein